MLFNTLSKFYILFLGFIKEAIHIYEVGHFKFPQGVS